VNRPAQEAWEYLVWHDYPRMKYAPEHYYTRWYRAGAAVAYGMYRAGQAIIYLLRPVALFCLAFWRTIDPRRD
jgi:hypothetical protein